MLLVTAAPAVLAAQDSATIAAGRHYRAGAMHRMLLGSGYRQAWAEPVRVPVLDLSRFGGGLTPTQEGGGKATESLRFRGGDGREYVFRSVDKTARRAVPEDLQGTVVEDIAQDQTAAKHPAAALPVPPILAAMGVLHVTPALFVMPDDPRLGEFREKWRGRLGQVEARLDDDVAGLLFPGAQDLESTEDLIEKLEEHPRNQVAAREYLKARLVDMWIGDWDRHLDQWRWARFDQGAVRLWRPVPRDRDNAFVQYEGLLIAPMRAARPSLVRFTPRIDAVYGLHYHSAQTDRRFLSVIDRAEWDSITNWVQVRLTDDLIEQAIGRLPPEYQRMDADLLRTGLRGRRDHLRTASAELYDLVARQAEVHGTNFAEVARITRRADGAVEVEMTSRDAPPGTGVRRLFVPAETDEVRVYLHGGDDEAVLDGPPLGAIKVRVIGGRGDDRLVEQSPTGGPGNTRFYDHQGTNEIRDGRGRTDRRDWETPIHVPFGGNPREPRDYGSLQSWFTPYGRWETNVGPVLGGGPSFITYGFRKVPFSSLVHLRALIAPGVANGYGAELYSLLRTTGGPRHFTVVLGANRFETTRFHGFGNDTERTLRPADYLVRHDYVAGEILMHDSLGGGWSFSLGPTAAWRDPRPRLGGPAEPGLPGADTYSMGGARLRLGFDRRDTLAVTRAGARWRAEGLGAAWSDGSPYGRVLTEARMYLPVGDGGPSLALRAGAEHALGDFPFQEAVYLGGTQRLRGYSGSRYAGDEGYWGSVELRQPLGQVRFIARGRAGIFGLLDAGRVWFDGESEGDWHTGYGGGLWFETIGQVLTLTVAHGEATKVYFGMGLPF